MWPETTGSETTGPETTRSETTLYATSPHRTTGTTPTSFTPLPSAAISMAVVRISVLVGLRRPHLKRRTMWTSATACIGCEAPHVGSSPTAEFVCESFECVIHVVLLLIVRQVDDISAIEL